MAVQELQASAAEINGKTTPAYLGSGIIAWNGGAPNRPQKPLRAVLLDDIFAAASGEGARVSVNRPARVKVDGHLYPAVVLEMYPGGTLEEAQAALTGNEKTLAEHALRLLEELAVEPDQMAGMSEARERVQ